MRSIKLVTGVVLIVAAITGFTFWESHGRDMLYETELAVASGDIKQGELITEKNVEARGIGSDYVMSGAVKAERMADIMGKKAKQYIPKGDRYRLTSLQTKMISFLKTENLYTVSAQI